MPRSWLLISSTMVECPSLAGERADEGTEFTGQDKQTILTRCQGGQMGAIVRILWWKVQGQVSYWGRVSAEGRYGSLTWSGGYLQRPLVGFIPYL